MLKRFSLILLLIFHLSNTHARSDIEDAKLFVKSTIFINFLVTLPSVYECYKQECEKEKILQLNDEEKYKYLLNFAEYNYDNKTVNHILKNKDNKEIISLYIKQILKQINKIEDESLNFIKGCYYITGSVLAFLFWATLN